MTQILLDQADVIELDQMHTFVAEWLSGNQRPILTKVSPSSSATPATTWTTSARPARIPVPARRQRRRTTLR